MTATATVKFTRLTNTLGEREYHYETDTHRYVTFQRDGRKGWWVTTIYTLDRVGTLEPALMVRGDYVTDLLNVTLAEARVGIAKDAERRSQGVPQHSNVTETVESVSETETDTDTVEAPVRPVRVTEGHYPSDTHSTIVQDALRALTDFPRARFTEGDSSLDSEANGVRVESSERGTVRVSWLVRGMAMDPQTYKPFVGKLTAIVGAFRAAGWNARVEGLHTVYAWPVSHTDE